MPGYGESGQWSLHSDRFDEAGVTAYYWFGRGGPVLAGVRVNGRTGPQVR